MCLFSNNDLEILKTKASVICVRLSIQIQNNIIIDTCVPGTCLFDKGQLSSEFDII